MRADWVAAAVRSRALAQDRVGAGGSRVAAAQLGLPAAIAALADTVYGPRLAGCDDLAAAERAVHHQVLWQLRVLAGWVPATSARLCRSAVGAYEADNLVALARQLDGGPSAPEPYDLGSLATAWTQSRAASSVGELRSALRRSPWGDVGTDHTPAWRDVLTVVSWRRLADVAPAARPWAQIIGALTAARIVLVDHEEPSARIRQLLRPMIGSGWEKAQDLADLRDSLPRSTQLLLRGVDDPGDLWRAEARAQVTIETDGFRLAHGALPGPDVVLGAIAVVMSDGWRVRAALAAASLGAGSSEVLDAVA